MDKNKIYCSDSLDFMKKISDYDIDVIYSDPPYALGSEVIVRKDGKVDYSKISDFMKKWNVPTGVWWGQWFKEAFRVLKYGGYCIVFGMDRQLLLFKYYAHLAGFEEYQSLYWYSISSFPKAVDLSKMIDSVFRAERKKVGEKVYWGHNAGSGAGSFSKNEFEGNIGEKRSEAITVPSTDLAKKYDGYKYSIASLKQTNETILVFHKPYKTGSCLYDTLAMENGDKECCCGALNINEGRVPIFDEGSVINDRSLGGGRYPSQTFCNGKAADVLNQQSGVKGPSGSVVSDSGRKSLNCYGDLPVVSFDTYGDSGGCSKILHQCEYEGEECCLYFYFSRVSSGERNLGLDEFEEKGDEDVLSDSLRAGGGRRVGRSNKNNHPTMKPISLNKRILSLFKTPNNQKILYPFAGVFSEIIGGYFAGFENFIGCEINEEYIKIGEARIEYWKKRGYSTSVKTKRNTGEFKDQSQLFLF